MNVMLTGGAGYIGSAVTREFLDLGFKVIVYDNLSKGHKSVLPEEAIFVLGDISDKKKLKETIFNYEINFVVHFAAYLEVAESVYKPSKYFHNNVINTINLLEAMLESNLKNIVFSSSAAVYGNPKSVPITEDFEKSPTSPYGESKMLMENVLQEFVEKYNFNAIALRYFNAAGAVEGCGEDHDPETHIIPRFIKSVLIGDDINIFGDGSHRRDYVHVKDLAKAHVLSVLWMKEQILVRSNGFFEAFNIGAGRMYTNLEMANKIIELVSKNRGYESGSRIIYLPERPGDPKDLMASNDKAGKYLNWTPENSDLEEIISDALKWHLSYQNEFNEENKFYEKSYLEIVDEIIYFLRICDSISKEFKIKFIGMLIKDEINSVSINNKKFVNNDEILSFIEKEFSLKNKVLDVLIQELKRI